MITYLMCDRIEGRPLYSPPPKNIIPALIGAGVALGTTIASIASSNRNRHEQQAVNSQNMDFQREMFDKKLARENYLNANSALLQRQSLEKAGLNPNIGAYGQLQSNLPNGTPSSQAYAMENPMNNAAVNSFGSLIQNQPLVDAQVENIKADTDKKKLEGENVKVDTLLKEAQKWSIEELTPEQKKQLQKGVDKMEDEIQNLRVDRELLRENIKKVMAETEGQNLENILTERSTPLILEQYAANISVLYSQKKLNDAQAAAAYKSIAVMTQQIKTLASQQHLNEAQTNYVAQSAISVALSNDYNKFRNSFKEEYVYNELKMNRKQIEAVEKGIESVQTNIDFAPLTAISSAAGSIGVAFGGTAAGLNQMKQLQGPTRITGFGR